MSAKLFTDRNSRPSASHRLAVRPHTTPRLTAVASTAGPGSIRTARPTAPRLLLRCLPAADSRLTRTTDLRRDLLVGASHAIRAVGCPLRSPGRGRVAVACLPCGGCDPVGASAAGVAAHAPTTRPRPAGAMDNVPNRPPVGPPWRGKHGDDAYLAWGAAGRGGSSRLTWGSRRERQGDGSGRPSPAETSAPLGWVHISPSEPTATSAR